MASPLNNEVILTLGENWELRKDAVKYVVYQKRINTETMEDYWLLQGKSRLTDGMDVAIKLLEMCYASTTGSIFGRF